MRAIPWPSAKTGADPPLTQGNPCNFTGVASVLMRNSNLGLSRWKLSHVQIIEHIRECWLTIG
jgi:hypothetical protein